jgi:iron complex outermembrane recepter protein
MKKIQQNRTFILNVMKFSILQILIVGFFAQISFAFDLKAQDFMSKSITLKAENTTLKKVLSQIESQSETRFVFSSTNIQSDRKVSINASQKPLSEVLTNLFRPLNITYKVIGGQIILSIDDRNAKNIVPNEPQTLEIQKTEDPIKGRVLNEKNEGFAGVNVLIKGTTRGTTTDGEGNFSINAKEGETLMVSFLGYKSQEVKIGSGSISVKMVEDASMLNDVVVVGSRFAKPRTDIDRPVAIDVINAKELQTSGQVDLGQTIHFAAPSFNAVKFGINDSAPFVDPATLRGLGPDQVLMLINNKRRHKVSFLSINDGVGKGQVGTDINVVPALSLKRVEVLRDGAAAQYGSDAIAGVINLELNDASEGGTVNIFTGIGYSKPNLDVTGVIAPTTIKDGLTYNANVNFGLKLTSKGYINTTLTYSHTDGYDRSGTYKASAGYYVKDATQDAALVAKNNINLNRAVLGSAENTTYGLFSNMGIQINSQWKWYAFGGYTHKHVITGVFTRPPSNTKRSVLEIFPNGYNPVAPADLQDYSIVTGFKGKIGENWDADFSASQGGNQVDWYAENTVNPSLGAASPTEFYVGQTKNAQTLINADISRMYNKNSYPNLSIGAGSEFRYENYKLTSGDPAAYEAGPLKKTKDVGSSGREGFSNKAAGKWGRTNIGVYVEAESDITKGFLVGGAIRYENYSDFGSNVAYKLNTRIKLAEPLALRASVSRGFRAPSMTQAYYSNFINISFDNAGNSIINPIIPATSDLAKLLGVNGLKQETSLDFSAGLTSKIGNHLTLTADVYQIDVDNRIMLSGGIDVSKMPQFVAAGFPQTANVFCNAIDTRTRGVEFVASYNTAIGSKSKLGVNVAYSSMGTTLRANRKTETGIEVADKTATLYITDGLPKNKLIASVNLEVAKFGIMVRASHFGVVSDPLATLAVKSSDPNAINYQVFSAKTLADIALTFKPTKKFSIIAGVNNLFDVYPDLLQLPQTTNEVVYSRRTNQFGTQGRFVNLTLNYNF